jgi:asparagine synthase (glutamine-hydrolysing)
MCGIAGMAGIVDDFLLRKMLAITRHRGPDDSGIYATNGHGAESSVAIGNNRLSIIDLSPAGHQPMCNEDGTLWVAYNGEMYNFPELRGELIRDGHQFRSNSDTEVLVHLYEKYGPVMVRHLNGMFAFAIWDSNHQELLIVRDRMGIKPLYYTQIEERLYFASEIKALLVCPEIGVEVDRQALCQYLAYLYVPNPATLFKGIFKLPPGHILRWKKGTVQIEPYWNLKYGDYFQDSEEVISRELRNLLFKITKRQLISDVPVGFFLSGGLDSSSLVACAAQIAQTELKCYSIAYKKEHSRFEQCNEDAEYAKLVATHFGAEFHEIVPEPEVTNLLAKAVWHMDTPIADPSAIATLLICEAAVSSVKVLLSGQGADEVFGGYRVHCAHKNNRLLQLIPRGVREKTAPSALKWLARHRDKAVGISPGLLLAFCRYSDKMLRTSTMQPRDQYASLRSYVSDEELSQLLSKESTACTADWSFRQSFLRHFADVETEDFINQMLYVDAKTFLPDLNLAYSDKLSMACSIEVRVPFLDDELVEFLEHVPPNMKIRGWTQKYILRKAMEPLLPRSVLRRRKAAFGLPIRSWLRNELREMLRDLLSKDRVRRRGLLDPAAVTRMIEDNEMDVRDYTLQLWGLLTLELWHTAFVDQRITIAPEQVLV